MIDPYTVEEGTRVKIGPGNLGFKTGVVDMVTEETNYARVQWKGVKRPDILSKSSPLWRHMELDT